MSALLDRSREFVLLRHAEEVSRRVDESKRAVALARLARARQRAEAADELWQTEHRAEALALARGAYALAADAAAALADGGDGDGAARLRAGLSAAGVPAKAVDALVAGHDERLAAQLPVLDADVTEAHAALHGSLVDARAAIDRALYAAMHRPDEIRTARRVRGAGVAAAGLAALVALGYVATRPPRATATASAFVAVDGGFPGSNAVDGDSATEWILPDQTRGWLDVTFSRPRDLRAVRLMNAHNREFNNVATRDWRLEAWDHDHLVASTHGTFPTLEPAPRWTSVPLEARNVTRVRFLVDSWHAVAGGLTDIGFE